jgi:hypothetical protein
MAKSETAPNPWTDCATCGWRNFVRLNENPTPSRGFVRASWTPDERCGSCGAELEEKQAA